MFLKNITSQLFLLVLLVFHRSSKVESNETSPFDSRPRIARTPLQGQKPSKETSSVKATSQGRLDPLPLSLGVTGYGILAERNHVNQNGLGIDQENQTTITGNNVNGSIHSSGSNIFWIPVVFFGQSVLFLWCNDSWLVVWNIWIIFP